MNRNPCVQRSVDKKVVDPGRLRTLEEVVSGNDAEIVFQTEEIVVGGVGEVNRDGVFDDRPTIGAHLLGVRRDGGVVQGSSARCGSVGCGCVRRRARGGGGTDQGCHEAGDTARGWLSKPGAVVGSWPRAVGAVGSALA